MGRMVKNTNKVDGLIFNTRHKTDEELLSLVNQYASLPEVNGISPTSAIRNFLVRSLKSYFKHRREGAQAPPF